VGLNVVTGGSVVKGHLHASLEGRGSSSELFGLTLGTGRQHVDFYTVQDHIAADTRSDLLYKSALKDDSRSVYYGLTRVGLNARNADANQVNRNLLLSKTAKADSDPVLEILTNDVIRVSHGATAGPVDQEQLYYLQARGIPYAEGEAMLVRAFLDQVLDRVPDDALREELGAIIDEKLAATDVMGTCGEARRSSAGHGPCRAGGGQTHRALQHRRGRLRHRRRMHARPRPARPGPARWAPD